MADPLPGASIRTRCLRRWRRRRLSDRVGWIPGRGWGSNLIWAGVAPGVSASGIPAVDEFRAVERLRAQVLAEGRIYCAMAQSRRRHLREAVAALV